MPKGQHGSSKLHRISQKLPAATLASLGRCHRRQAFTILVKRLSLSVLSSRLFQCCIASIPSDAQIIFATSPQHAAVPIYANDPDTYRLKSFKPLFLLSRKIEGCAGELGAIFGSSRNPSDNGRKPLVVRLIVQIDTFTISTPPMLYATIHTAAVLNSDVAQSLLLYLSCG